MEEMHVESSLNQPNISDDDHMEMGHMDHVSFGILATTSRDDLLDGDQLVSDKLPTVEEGLSSATSAASSDEDPTPWRQEVGELSLPEINGSIKITDEDNASWFKKLLAFVGPGALVAVGYMDVSILFVYILVL